MGPQARDLDEIGWSSEWGFEAALALLLTAALGPGMPGFELLGCFITFSITIRTLIILIIMIIAITLTIITIITIAITITLTIPNTTTTTTNISIIIAVESYIKISRTFHMSIVITIGHVVYDITIMVIVIVLVVGIVRAEQIITNINHD